MLSDLLENCDRVLRPSHLSRLAVAPFSDWSWYLADRHGAIRGKLRKSGSPTTCLGKKRHLSDRLLELLVRNHNNKKKGGV